MAAAVARSALLVLLWLALAGFHPADLPAAVLAVGLATWVSLKLLPASDATPSPAAIAMMALRFPGQSIRAGVDVAIRALQPQPRLSPGYVTFHSRLPAGDAREAFCTWTSLLPGALPSGTTANGALLIHCLDTGQDITRQMAREEARFLRALGRPDGG